MEIILLGEPRSTNNAYKTMCRGRFPTRYMDTKSRSLKDSYIEQARKQWQGQPLSGELEVWIEIFFGNKRKNDWDNFHKLSMDSLTGICYYDDSQIHHAHVSKYYDHDNPRIEIIINEIQVK